VVDLADDLGGGPPGVRDADGVGGPVGKCDRRGVNRRDGEDSEVMAAVWTRGHLQSEIIPVRIEQSPVVPCVVSRHAKCSNIQVFELNNR
jgi:hypothetical protein